ncbi:MAG: serine hydroxymethyltransferase, partial [Candidatus Woesebacteria bacterium]|nr:serine hydroxymethyltransferase [Candidatus Woesebacteria bacterium]
TTAGIAIALSEAERLSFKEYGKQIVANAKLLAELLKKGGLTVVCGRTECHLIVVDLRPLGISGGVVAQALEGAGIIVNKNSVPNDTAPPYRPSGIRLGTPAITTRGMKENEIKIIAEWILEVVKNPTDEKLQCNIAKEVKNLCKKFKCP